MIIYRMKRSMYIAIRDGGRNRLSHNEIIEYVQQTFFIRNTICDIQTY